MGVARSSFYAAPIGKPADAVIVGEIRDITDEFEGYGYRRVDAELRHRGFVVNAKKVRRLMKENDLNPRRRRRFVRTTDSDHDSPIFPFVAREFGVHGPDQLWVIDGRDGWLSAIAFHAVHDACDAVGAGAGPWKVKWPEWWRAVTPGREPSGSTTAAAIGRCRFSAFHACLNHWMVSAAVSMMSFPAESPCQNALAGRQPLYGSRDFSPGSGAPRAAGFR